LKLEVGGRRGEGRRRLRSRLRRKGWKLEVGGRRGEGRRLREEGEA
jgi:hypothetical protein